MAVRKITRTVKPKSAWHISFDDDRQNFFKDISTGEIGVTEGILKDRMHDSQFVPPTAKKARTVLRTGWDR